MVAMDSIGRYRLIRRLGAGSFATVRLGHDDDLDVPVALIRYGHCDCAPMPAARSMCCTATTSSIPMSPRETC
jgi:serine/threonine protein kinase